MVCVRSVRLSWSAPAVPFRDTPAGSTPLLIALAPGVGSATGGVPRDSVDAPEDLPTQAPRQVARGQLEDVVPGVPDEAPAGLEQRCWRARQGPALDGEGQGEPAQQVAEIVGSDP